MSDYTISEIKKIIRPIAEKHGVKKISLFGSRARGDNRTDSDYDFLVTNGKIDSLLKHAALLIDLEESLNSEVDVVMDSSNDLDFISEAKSDEVVLYEN